MVIDYSRVWEFLGWGWILGVLFSFMFHMWGVWGGIGLRWFERMVGGDE